MDNSTILLEDRKDTAPIKVFLSGKMTGEPDYGYPLFEAFEKQLRHRGYLVINPSSVGIHENWSWEDYMKEDLIHLLCADIVALLPGFYNSRGAREEMYIAGTVGMKVVPIEFLLNN